MNIESYYLSTHASITMTFEDVDLPRQQVQRCGQLFITTDRARRYLKERYKIMYPSYMPDLVIQPRGD